MRQSPSLIAVSLTAVSGFFLAATVLLTAPPGFAQASVEKFRGGAVGAIEPPRAAGEANQDQAAPGTCTCSNGGPAGSDNPAPLDREQRERLWPKPSLADLKATLDDSDAIAALEAVQLALTEVGDGATYVWHRRHGRLSGAIKPTSSFKDASGSVCRHIVVALTSGSYSRKAEGIACRQRNGVWVLEG